MVGRKKGEKPEDLSLNALLQGHAVDGQQTNQIKEPILYPTVEIRKGKDILKSDYEMISHHLEFFNRMQESVFNIKKRKYDFDVKKLYNYQSYFPDELVASSRKKKKKKLDFDDPNFETLEKDEKENKDEEKKEEKPKEKKETEDSEEEEEGEKKGEKDFDADDYTTGYFNEDDEEFGETEDVRGGGDEGEEPVF